MQWRWKSGATAKQRAQIEHELHLIHTKQYESYFLTVHDIVRFARRQQILCQGRGSAANSSVCYVLGVNCFSGPSAWISKCRCGASGLALPVLPT